MNREKVKIYCLEILLLFVMLLLPTASFADSNYWQIYFKDTERIAIQKVAQSYTRSEIKKKSKDWKGIISGFHIKNESIKSDDIKSINADKIESGTLSGLLSWNSGQTFVADKLTGTYAALDGSNITNLDPVNISEGSLDLGSGSLVSGSINIGTTASGGNQTVSATLGSNLSPDYSGASGVNWTLGSGWETPINGGVLNKNADGEGTATPSAASTIATGVTYKVIITPNITTGQFGVSIGGAFLGTISGNTPVTQYFTAVTTGNVIISPSNTSRGTIAVSWQVLTETTGDLVVIGEFSSKSPPVFDSNRILAGGLGVSASMFVGTETGATSTGLGNTGFGYRPLKLVTTGGDNTAIGANVLTSVTTGRMNTGVGADALVLNTGNYNTGIGKVALYSNTSGEANTAVGYFALYASGTANQGTAVGSSCLKASTGADNTGLGAAAGFAVTTGRRNTLIGSNAATNLTTGESNIIIGYNVPADAVDTSNSINIGGQWKGNVSTGGLSLTEGDFTAATAGKGIVLTNAAGTVTKRVRLNDAGDGLIFEEP